MPDLEFCLYNDTTLNFGIGKYWLHSNLHLRLRETTAVVMLRMNISQTLVLNEQISSYPVVHF
jgi:hypothetical protein